MGEVKTCLPQRAFVQLLKEISPQDEHKDTLVDATEDGFLLLVGKAGLLSRIIDQELDSLGMHRLGTKVIVIVVCCYLDIIIVSGSHSGLTINARKEAKGVIPFCLPSLSDTSLFWDVMLSVKFEEIVEGS
jgi:hypothetical protein